MAGRKVRRRKSSRKKISGRWYDVGILVLILVFVAYATPGIATPWSNDHNGFLAKEKAHYAINYLKYGYLETKLGQMISEGGSMDSLKQKYSFYVHHPMLISLLVSFSFLAFGIKEWALRIVPILINVGIIAFLYLFAKTYWDKKIALIACFFAVLFPMFFFNRNLAAFEVLALFFVCLMLYFYVRWLKSKSRRDFIMMLATLFLGSLSDWQFYFVVPVIVAHYLVFVREKKKDKRILLLIPAALLAFALYLGYVFLLTGAVGGTGVGGGLWGNLLLRINIGESAKICNINAAVIFGRIIRDTSHFFTPAFLFIPLAFIVFLAIKMLRKNKIAKEGLPLLLFFSYLSFLFIFSHMYMACEYVIMFLTIPLSLFASLMIAELISVKKLILKALFCAAILAFGIYYVHAAYSTDIQIYRLNNLRLPLNDFLSQNHGDIMVSFGEDSDFYQLRPYLDIRVVREVKEKALLLELLKGSNFSYFFAKIGQPLDPELESYLKENFSYEEIYNRKEESYLVFDLKESLQK